MGAEAAALTALGVGSARTGSGMLPDGPARSAEVGGLETRGPASSTQMALATGRVA